ncbi:hypothetical protein MATL_G00242160 [Megalops atlanticus]|uniref:Uncharacterized protein n=1 Tax=Megalops atlanticus TaxID=7932 RepID=A0A9D3PFS4_MEGAT|nr:hypothetical protein MATL_G00242160 [Megalops atlanticus]
MQGQVNNATLEEMEKIYPLLEEFRLQAFYSKFLDFGVKDVQDFVDSIDDDMLNSLGLSQVEKKRFGDMQTHIKRLGSVNTGLVKKSMEAFHVTYRFPKCSEPKQISGIDPSQNTLEDLMVRISHQENIGNDKAVCLYSVEGMPLTDDPFFNTWCLDERHVKNGSELYAIFTPKENLRTPHRTQPQLYSDIPGDDTVRCHIMLKGDYEVNVDLDKDTLKDLRQKLSLESGIPADVLHAKNIQGGSELLKNLGISCESVVHFYLSSFDDTYLDRTAFFASDVSPCVQQTQKGMSTFFSTLYAINKRHTGQQFLRVIAYIRKLTGCSALAQALYQLICKNEYGTRSQKIAVVEGLYILFRELLPSLTKRMGPRIIEDPEVFEYSPVCWAYLLSQAESEKYSQETYATISLICGGSEQHLCEPVRVPGIPVVYERSYVLDKIRDEEKIPNCTEENLKETSIQKATDIERIVLSLPAQATYFHLWISYSSVSSRNFQINPEKTFDEMTEGVSAYSHLMVTPPLKLKSTGTEGPLLLLIEKENLGVYLSKNKMCPSQVEVFDCLSGKLKTVDLDVLANQLRDVRSDHTFKTTRVPQEAILVLVDSSSSMARDCYESMTRIEAVKQLFHCFTDRTMAYDFHHVISLVTFGREVKQFHTFTETLETFKKYVDNLQAAGKTPLYDALNYGIAQLENVKKQFPDCRLRTLCLTDGHDEGSLNDPVNVAVRLINSNIVVDSILLGNEENTVLHGISNATGGCCFKPMMGKEALKLFEMETVLSLERRKLKRKFDASSIQTLAHLKEIFETHGYDDKPEVALPKEINDKVTLTQNALKKKIQESKTGKFIEKDKRILEELKNLHCEPHPYCTVLPSETDISFWKILMTGHPDTPYENGNFELYCQFGAEYPMKPPLVHFLTPIYHCNVNSVGRICHNIFDRNYNAHVTMKEILDAVFGLLIAPEPEDPLDSVLAEEFLSSRDKYEEQAKKNTAEAAGTPMEDMEKKLVGKDLSEVQNPDHLICKISKKLFVDPVRTCYGNVYERKTIEKHLKFERKDPFNKKLLRRTDLKPDKEMKQMVKMYRRRQIQETAV